jgi:hypothetical protein
MEFTLKQAQDLVELFGGSDPDYPEETITVVEVDSDEPSHSGPGLYAYHTEYPDEGAIILG